MKYEVIVANIGTVYSGTCRKTAKSIWNGYLKQSKANYGRAGGENVCMMENGEILPSFDYIGHLERMRNF